MEIILTGSTGGIGSAIKERLKDHELTCIPHANIETEKQFDWLICAHGVINEEDVLETFYANVLSNIYLVEDLKPKNIIFISSTAAITGNYKYPIYAASKAALNMYHRSISQKYNCYTICPGPTDTKMWRKLGLEGKAQDPNEVAKVVERIINGEFESGDIIIVRNGEVRIL